MMLKKQLNSKKIIHFFTTSVTAYAFMRPHFLKLKKNGWNNKIIAGDVGWSKDLLATGAEFENAPYLRNPNFINIIISFLYTFKKVINLRDSLIISHTPVASFYVALACFILRQRFIFYCHGLVSSGNSGGLKNRVIYNVERFVCRAAYTVIFVSPSLREFAVLQNYVENTKAISYTGSICGVDYFDCLPRTFPTSCLRIGYFGRITKDKGAFDCISVLDILEKKGIYCRLIFAGQIEDTEFEALIANSSNVQYVGFISDKAEFFKKIDILIYPSRREGFGMSALEAASFGVPVVGFNIVGLCDAVSNGFTGILVDLGDIVELAEAIVEYEKDHSLYYLHSDLSLKRAREIYGVDKIVNEQIKIIEDLYASFR